MIDGSRNAELIALCLVHKCSKIEMTSEFCPVYVNSVAFHRLDCVIHQVHFPISKPSRDQCCSTPSRTSHRSNRRRLTSCQRFLPLGRDQSRNLPQINQPSPSLSFRESPRSRCHSTTEALQGVFLLHFLDDFVSRVRVLKIATVAIKARLSALALCAKPRSPHNANSTHFENSGLHNGSLPSFPPIN